LIELPIVIPTDNNHNYLRNFIKQCKNLELKNLIVIDNTSSDDEMKNPLKSIKKRL
jgi:hypothetical protein